MFINIEELKEDAIKLLINLINTKSFSKEENRTADIISNFLEKRKIKIKRKYNNIWMISENYLHSNVQTILLNSHHDTVKPGENWDTDPFSAIRKGDKLIGLGSNDAGASVVSLISTFIYLNQLPYLPFKLILAITAEEEISGKKGLISILDELGVINLGIVGEPTQMKVAIAEKGLIVLDCLSHGKTGHAAKNNGINALYIALDDIKLLREYKFKKISNLLGSVKITITQISAGIQHNIIPDICSFVVDIRTNEYYKNKEVIFLISKKLRSEIISRSDNLNSSYIDQKHSILREVKKLKFETFGSDTLSDQSIMNFPTIKMGPGDSIRSHTPNEYILCSEIKKAIDSYIKLLKNYYP